METFRRLSLIAATVTTGLTAGLLFGFACSVMPALAGVDDATFVTVMRRINVAILNPAFLLCFVGGLVFGAVAIAVHVGTGRTGVLIWSGCALALYLVALAVTAAGNVPLNDALAGADVSQPVSALREGFEARWVGWHLVRTVAAAGSLVAWAGALTARLG